MIDNEGEMMCVEELNDTNLAVLYSLLSYSIVLYLIVVLGSPLNGTNPV